MGELGRALHKSGKPWHSEIDEELFPDDLYRVLCSLVGGTLDVDRMDYLRRDAKYCGVTYGDIDLDHLIGGLELVGASGRTSLALRDKAILAMDDLLWSRHHMFLQVYGHKTNVAFNTMLERAIPDAISDLPHFEVPRDYASFAEFTDDFVMSQIFSLCAHGKRLAETSYGKTLARRIVPTHLAQVRLHESRTRSLPK